VLQCLGEGEGRGCHTQYPLGVGWAYVYRQGRGWAHRLDMRVQMVWTCRGCEQRVLQCLGEGEARNREQRRCWCYGGGINRGRGRIGPRAGDSAV
jgi:hypothetical protein